MNYPYNYRNNYPDYDSYSPSNGDIRNSPRQKTFSPRQKKSSPRLEKSYNDDIYTNRQSGKSPMQSSLANKNYYYHDYTYPNPLQTANYYYRNGVLNTPGDFMNYNQGINYNQGYGYNTPIGRLNAYCGCGVGKQDWRY